MFSPHTITIFPPALLTLLIPNTRANHIITYTTPRYIQVTLRVFTYPNWFRLQFQTSSDTENTECLKPYQQSRVTKCKPYALLKGM